MKLWFRVIECHTLVECDDASRLSTSIIEFEERRSLGGWMRATLLMVALMGEV
jgi:hypothetical protein